MHHRLLRSFCAAFCQRSLRSSDHYVPCSLNPRPSVLGRSFLTPAGRVHVLLGEGLGKPGVCSPMLSARPGTQLVPHMHLSNNYVKKLHECMVLEPEGISDKTDGHFQKKANPRKTRSLHNTSLLEQPSELPAPLEYSLSPLMPRCVPARLSH